MRSMLSGSSPLAMETAMGEGPRTGVTMPASERAPPELAARTATSTPAAACPSASGPWSFRVAGRRSFSAGCLPSASSCWRARPSCSLAHRVASSPFRAKWMASAVPAAPAPNTVTRATARSIPGREKVSEGHAGRALCEDLDDLHRRPDARSLDEILLGDPPRLRACLARPHRGAGFEQLAKGIGGGRQGLPLHPLRGALGGQPPGIAGQDDGDDLP